jgi:hypothetical protein
MSGRSKPSVNRPCSLIFISAAVLLILALWIAFVRKAERDGEWRSHFGRMRRWKSGVWEYRPMTDDEIIDENSRDAW